MGRRWGVGDLEGVCLGAGVVEAPQDLINTWHVDGNVNGRPWRRRV